MPVTTRISHVVLLLVLFLSSCMKDDQNDSRALDINSGGIPVVSTKTVTNITQVSALCGGRIVTDNGSPVIAYGVCWSTLPMPTIDDKCTNDGAGNGNYTSMLSNLSVGTTYYIRAFAKNANGIGYGGQQTFTTDSILQLGIEYEGGIIFYLDPTGMHGLVCAKSDQSTSAAWGCANTQITGADNTALGSGQENSLDIINGCHSNGIAAKICLDANMNGYSDWYLPSKDELKLMYNNLQTIHVGDFSNIAYWSSTEMTNVFAWQIAFNSGIIQGATKTVQSGVRAIRAF